MSSEAFVGEVCRFTLLLVFAMSVFGKAKDIRAFEAAVAKFRLIPFRFVGPVARMVVGLEYLVILLLLMGIAFREATWWGFLTSALILLGFSVLLVWVVVGKKDISCGCFGDHSQPIGGWDIVRNFSLLAVGSIGANMFASVKFGVEAVVFLLAVPSGLCLALLFANFSNIGQTLSSKLEA